jgi:arsenite methyltransferase
MIALARSNASKHSYGNVEFVKAAITSVPLDSSMADCIISNCVVNLVPQGEKHLVFKEMYRLLKTGGRVAVGDLLARKPLPEDVRLNVAAYVGCIAGAAEVSDYESWLHEAGFDGEPSSAKGMTRNESGLTRGHRHSDCGHETGHEHIR